MRTHTEKLLENISKRTAAAESDRQMIEAWLKENTVTECRDNDRAHAKAAVKSFTSGSFILSEPEYIIIVLVNINNL